LEFVNAMAKVKIETHDAAFRDLLKSDDMYKIVKSVADDVLAEAEATASDAEKGSGGTIDGYASSGFSIVRKQGGTRVEAHVQSNASPEIFLKAFFYTAKRDGVAHIRRALYKFTKRGA